MSDIDRRKFVGASAAGLAGLMSGGPGAAQQAPREPAASADAPADVTRALAAYVVKARPEDLPAPVRREACRTLLNWAGCAVGGSQHETVDIAVARAAAVLRRAAGEPARTARAHGHPARVADERHQLARPRFRRHPPEDRHPSGRPGRVRHPGARRNAPGLGTRLPARARARRRSRVPHRQRRVSRALRSRLAHHRHDRCLRRRGRQRTAARAVGTADALGLRSRRHAAGRPARDVRHDDEELSPRPRRPERTDGGAAGERRLHQQRRRPRRADRLGARAQHRVRLHADHARASASTTRSRSTPTSRSRAASCCIRSSTPACSCGPRTISPPTRSIASTLPCIRSCSS